MRPWIHGPRRNELAVVHVSAGQRRGDVRLRDVLGASFNAVRYDARNPDALKRLVGAGSKLEVFSVDT